MIMRLALSLCLGLVLSCAASAQQNPAYYQTGIPINSAQVPIPLGFVNALTGKAHLEIPIASVSERNGIPVTARMIYDTYLVANNGNGYQPGGWSGFIYGTEKERESVAWDTVQVACTLAQYPYGDNVKYTNVQVTDLAGTHQVVLANGTSWPGYTLKIGCYDQFGNYENPADGTSPNTSGSDVDGLGYSLQITNYNLVKAIDIDGTVFSDPSIINNQPYDTNGNIMWTANGDTLGRKVITSSSPSSCTSLNTNPVYLYVKVSDGSTQTYTLNCQTYSVISGGYPAGTVHLPSSLVLPNGTQCTFTYDTGSTGTHYAVLTGVTLPTGGTVTPASDLSSATFGGGTWAFNYVVTVAGSNSNTVTTVTG